ncbi:hypothetical protein HPC37_06190 [Pasteurellaceae bacterium 20609_3]|uniref:hypothetical protein n=1 Tax=Spirabiliibacterium mucosae TaxID=28156 RepID=UPI001AAE1527|nr:hypothetical protein [Spirabiliibacterium mucosae]MBE2898405.1 hypothetical protein [Spirabiliibacterium mucosae]
MKLTSQQEKMLSATALNSVCIEALALLSSEQGQLLEKDFPNVMSELSFDLTDSRHRAQLSQKMAYAERVLRQLSSVLDDEQIEQLKQLMNEKQAQLNATKDPFDTLCLSRELSYFSAVLADR